MSETDVLLRLFKEQLENESQDLATNYELTKRGDRLIWWYFLKLKGFTPDDIDEFVCDDSGDLGLDAIYIDDNNIVHFYQFKNPNNIDAGFPAGDVDKIIGGLNLVLAERYNLVANEDLKARIEEIYQVVRDGYRLHLVISANGGLPVEAEVKLNAFVDNLGASAKSYFTWSYEDLHFLQEAFYKKNLPTVDKPISFTLESPPYMVKSANHECYLFHLHGDKLAQLYDEHDEKLLQQNIRIYQGDTATNNSIYDACTGGQSGNFFHYNNGVTFLCESAGFDCFGKVLTLEKAQVVNGGQTIRVIHSAYNDKRLKNDILVSVRVITSQGDKEFAGDVAVNLNNQNRMENSFLRSNSPQIIQLASALASTGWYLERREGEVEHLSTAEQEIIAQRIGRPLTNAVINLKEGTQAYVCTYCREPELAKKNPGKMFLSMNGGGYFERIFSTQISAEKFVIAQQIQWEISDFVRNFSAHKRRKNRSFDWKAEYSEILDKKLVEEHASLLDQIIPQCAIFLCAILFENYVRIQNRKPMDLLEDLRSRKKKIVSASIDNIIKFALANPDIADKSWPTLLKSQSFFDKYADHIKQSHTRNNA